MFCFTSRTGGNKQHTPIYLVFVLWVLWAFWLKVELSLTFPDVDWVEEASQDVLDKVHALNVFLM